MEYTYIKSYGTDIEVTIDKYLVLFEQGEIAEKHEYSTSYFMDGYVNDVKKYEAIGEFMNDDFIELVDLDYCVE